ncbi:unnamed protein product [Angiostrongylus costaricensis]|uniref:Uncharacterized protein n=1 Tax=Angiostrongylus costaricensis TaxID=334426 RepID=A0A0R3PU17_ANGCS|nr:unnamed protein product [Angiostrongylus costaricensis]
MAAAAGRGKGFAESEWGPAGSALPGTPRPLGPCQMALRCARERAPSLMEAPLFATATVTSTAGLASAGLPSAAPTSNAHPNPPRHITATPHRHLFAAAATAGAELLGNNCWTSEETWHNVYSWINNAQVRASIEQCLIVVVH